MAKVSVKKDKKTARKKEENPQNMWQGVTSTVGYGLFILVIVYLTFILSRKLGLNMGICPFIVPGCS